MDHEFGNFFRFSFLNRIHSTIVKRYRESLVSNIGYFPYYITKPAFFLKGKIYGVVAAVGSVGATVTVVAELAGAGAVLAEGVEALEGAADVLLVAAGAGALEGAADVLLVAVGSGLIVGTVGAEVEEPVSVLAEVLEEVAVVETVVEVPATEPLEALVVGVEPEETDEPPPEVTMVPCPVGWLTT